MIFTNAKAKRMEEERLAWALEKAAHSAKDRPYLNVYAVMPAGTLDTEETAKFLEGKAEKWGYRYDHKERDWSGTAGEPWQDKEVGQDEGPQLWAYCLYRWSDYTWGDEIAWRRIGPVAGWVIADYRIVYDFRDAEEDAEE